MSAQHLRIALQRRIALRNVGLIHSTRAYASQPHFNEPSGHLFGELPREPGEKRVREDWELIWYIGMGGSIVLATMAFYFKPDTSISTWALHEAKQRLEARGDAAKYIPSNNSHSSS